MEELQQALEELKPEIQDLIIRLEKDAREYIDCPFEFNGVRLNLRIEKE